MSIALAYSTLASLALRHPYTHTHTHTHTRSLPSCLSPEHADGSDVPPAGRPAAVPGDLLAEDTGVGRDRGRGLGHLHHAWPTPTSSHHCPTSQEGCWETRWDELLNLWTLLGIKWWIEKHSHTIRWQTHNTHNTQHTQHTYTFTDYKMTNTKRSSSHTAVCITYRL